jgi:hypothetical protein
VAPAHGVGASQGHNLLVVETLGVEHVAEVVAALGSVGQAPIGWDAVRGLECTHTPRKNPRLWIGVAALCVCGTYVCVGGGGGETQGGEGSRARRVPTTKARAAKHTLASVRPGLHLIVGPPISSTATTPARVYRSA